jgi:hypothetical protein
MVLTDLDNIAGVYTRVNIKVGSREAFKTANNWLSNCIELHEECPSPKNLYMPTRIIEIVDWDQRWVRLRHTNDKEITLYTALSYRWGEDLPSKTTKELLPRYEARIPWQHMPRTIQDAIITTLEFGIRFLWAGSLCMIQGSSKDIASEISRMPRIFTNTMVTIAASRAGNT